MIRIRQVEEAIADEYSKASMRCPTHLSIGQEAVGAVLGIALNKSDFVVSGHRAHAHYLGKGGNLKKMLAEIYGKKTGCSSGIGGSMHLADPSVGFMGSTAIVANSIPVGVGLALSAQLHRTSQVSCCCFGDGAIEEGVFYESANFAALKKLPVLFLCENNLYSVYSPLSVRQPKQRKIYQLAESIGLRSQIVDGNDAQDVIDAIEKAAEYARQGNGPSFIEFTTYRWREHCGPNYDNEVGYRTVEEFNFWKERDPISQLKAVLINKNAENYKEIEDQYNSYLTSVKSEIKDAFIFADESSYPSKNAYYQYVYSSDEQL